MDISRKIFAGIIAILCMASCEGSKTKSEAMGPEGVVEAFTKAITAGDFEQACGFCDESLMGDYLENFMNTWMVLHKKDSSVLLTASSILSEAAIRIDKVAKENEGRTVYYRIEAEGQVRNKKAELKKEEGEWKIQAITDGIWAE